MGNFRSVSIRTSLINQVEEVMQKLGFYDSIADFVSEAIRLRLEYYTKNPKEVSS